jgi:Ca2+-binding RTX toxin-like protein
MKLKRLLALASFLSWLTLLCLLSILRASAAGLEIQHGGLQQFRVRFDYPGLAIPAACAHIEFDNLLEGTNGDDHIQGNDRLFGESENDVLLGGQGDDELDGGDCHDQCDGEAGNDTLIACEV